MLQGEEAVLGGVTLLISKILNGEEGGIVLTNYTKDGRRFRNQPLAGRTNGGWSVRGSLA